MAIKKLTIVIGAGATLSDVMGRPLRSRPPLDKGFFKGVRAKGSPDLEVVLNYMRDNYDIDPVSDPDDSLEAVMSVLYSDIYNPLGSRRATAAFRSLLRLLNHRLAQTTNNIEVSHRSNLYRILCNYFRQDFTPKHITIITFNQDLQIEKTLNRLEGVRAWVHLGRIFNFPYCYCLPNYKLSEPPRRVATFDRGDPNDTGIRILKLHGSLNWYSKHIARDPTPSTLLNPNRELVITRRSEISTDMTYSSEKRTMHTFPIVVPPVTHKARILHKDLASVWSEAQEALKKSTDFVVFGYSCPQQDFESANLLSRNIRTNERIRDFSVIDPSPVTFQRYVDLTGLDRLFFYRSANAFLRA